MNENRGEVGNILNKEMFYNDGEESDKVPLLYQ